jgi:hypothetical protein
MEWLSAARRAVAGLSIVMVAGCATPPPPQGPLQRIEGRLVDREVPHLALRDRRPAPQRTSADAGALEIATPLGVGRRLDESVFAQPPLEALDQVLAEELANDGVHLQQPVDLLALDVATIRGGPLSRNRARQTVLPVLGPIHPAAAVAAALVVVAIDQPRPEPEALTSLYLRAVLAHRDVQSVCEGSGTFTQNAEAADAWRAAVWEAIRSCKARFNDGTP